jgi:hypothetical protein
MRTRAALVSKRLPLSHANRTMIQRTFEKAPLARPDVGAPAGFEPFRAAPSVAAETRTFSGLTRPFRPNSTQTYEGHERTARRQLGQLGAAVGCDLNLRRDKPNNFLGCAVPTGPHGRSRAGSDSWAGPLQEGRRSGLSLVGRVS